MEEKHTLQTLIVDDEEPFRRVMAVLLQTKGDFDVDECDSGEAALEALRRKAYDVVVLDYRMQDVSGLNVLQWMFEQKMDTPVIVLTGAGSEHIAVEAMKLGAYDYIRKDQFDQQRLPLIINGVYERYLFKKEKEKLEGLSREREKDIVSMDLLRNAIALSANLVNNTLTDIVRSIDRYRESLQPLLKVEGHEVLERITTDLKKEYHFMSVIAKSLSDLADLTEERLRGTQNAVGKESPQVQEHLP